MIAPKAPASKFHFPVNSVEDAWQLLVRHRGKSLAFFCGSMLLVLLGLMVVPKTYTSEAKLFVRVGRESITVDPTATVGQTISVYESRESEINSVLEVIQSRVILEDAVEALGVATILPGYSDTPSTRESAARVLEQALFIERGHKSSVISVTCRANSPERAQLFVGAILTAFENRHLQANRTKGSYEFFVQQSRVLESRLADTSKQLSDAKNGLGVVTVELHRKTLQEQVTAIETVTVTAESELHASEAKVAALKTELARIPERLQTLEVRQPNLSADTTRQKLQELKIREEDLLARFTPLHPQVAATQRQIIEAEKLLSAQEAYRFETTNGTNPSYQQLQVSLASEEANAASLRAKVESLHRQFGELQAQLRKLNSSEAMITKLEKDVELLQTNRQAYAEKLEQTRIDQALETERISNVNVVQPPTFMPRPVSPKKWVILALGMFLAALGAACVPLLAEVIEWPELNPQHDDRGWVPVAHS